VQFPQGFLIDLQRMPKERLRLAILTSAPVEVAEPLAGAGCSRMLVAQKPLANVQRALGKRDGVAGVPLPLEIVNLRHVPISVRQLVALRGAHARPNFHVVNGESGVRHAPVLVAVQFAAYR
jgi:hypothetical protein